jgi:hypothetical protein
MCRGSGGMLKRLVYTNENISRLLAFDSTFSIESFVITALTPQRFSFSRFSVYCDGHIFITNRHKVNYSFWSSFSRFSCSQTSNVHIILNVTHEYRVSSERNVQAISANTSQLIGYAPTTFSQPSILHFQPPCTDNFNFSIEGDSVQSDEILEVSIPDRFGNTGQGGRVPSAVPEYQSTSLPIYVGVAVVVLALGAITGVAVLRGCIRDRNRALGEIKVVRSAFDVSYPDPRRHIYACNPPFIHVRRDLEESTTASENEDNEVILPPDPYALNPENLYGNQVRVVSPREGDSPYDSYDVIPV